ncbi:Cu-binding protein [Rhizophlyctis rosea]|nr:Cu-binding protein [Rhizophlyctis rosea]
MPNPHGVQQEAARSNYTYLRAAAVIVLSGAGLLYYFDREKRLIAEKRAAQKNESVGRPLVGGSFCLVDHTGTPVTDLDFLGKWMLVYFGYTFCPDVCPEELEKMAEVVDRLAKEGGFTNETIVPIFISCDPKRDSIESIREYVHGLTGTHAQIKRIAKSYRLYFSAPPKAVDDDETDYLVDHSIFFYLIGPDGKYRAHFGKTDTAPEVVAKILQELRGKEDK